MPFRRVIASLLLLSLTSAASVAAELRVNSLFSDHMVLQADKPVAIWGTGTSGEKVKVTINQGAAVESAVDANGKWSLRLPAMTASAEGSILQVTSGDKTVVANDVLVGEVWVASGQSNMAYTLDKSEGSKEAVASAKYPWLRMYKVPANPVAKPIDDSNGNWIVCDPTTASRFAAVPFFFAREFYAHRKVPIGIIQSSLGGTPVEAWTRTAILNELAELKPFMSRWDALLKDYDPKTYPERSKQEQADFKAQVSALQAKGEHPSAFPERPPIIMPKVIPGWLYSGMIHPLMPYTIRGVIWYQGESNVDDAWLYQFTFPAMIKDWRAQWGQGDFPFLFVQLSGRETKPAPEFTGANVAELREMQSKALSLPQTGMAIAIDTTAVDWHPANKLPPGVRLSLLARGIAYGEPGLEYRSPSLDRFEIREDAIVIHIKDAPRGLTSHDKQPGSFTLAGKDQVFVVADATIDGSTLTLRAPGITEPVAARYAWARGPECNVYSVSSNLPLTPFRTDAWPETTRPKDSH